MTLKGNTAFTHPKPVPKGPRNSTKVNEFKLVVGSPTLNKEKKNDEVPHDVQALNQQNNDINSAEVSPTKKDNLEFNKTQSVDNLPTGDDGQNNDTGAEGHANQLAPSMLIVHDLPHKTTLEESSQNDDSTKDPSIKESQSDASSHHTHSNKENTPELQKITSPNITRKTHNSKNKVLDEGKSVSTDHFSEHLLTN